MTVVEMGNILLEDKTANFLNSEDSDDEGK